MKMATKKKKAEVEVSTEEIETTQVKKDESPRFTYEQLVNSERYKKYAYLLDVKLDKDVMYTLGEVDEMLKEMI